MRLFQRRNWRRRVGRPVCRQ